MYLPVAGVVPAIVGLNVAADLETDLSSGDVIEALAVERAYLHIFDRLGFDRKIRSLRPSNRD
jgi:hypothetical protein